MGTIYSSEDTYKTMSLPVRRLNASLHTHPLMYNVYKSQFPNSFSPAVSYILQSVQVHNYNYCFYKTYEGTTPSSSSPASTPAAWAHLRALRDIGNTCHGSPDLGEGSSRDHTCTTSPWNAKRRRQDYRCTCMCGNSRRCPMSSGDKQDIRVTHRVYIELSISGTQQEEGEGEGGSILLGTL